MIGYMPNFCDYNVYLHVIPLFDLKYLLFSEVHKLSDLPQNYVLNSNLTIFVEFMQNVYVKLHKTLQSFETSEEFCPDIYAISHKL